MKPSDTAYTCNADYMLAQLKNLLAIDSTTSFYGPIEDYLATESASMGYSVSRLRKGGLTVDLGGEGEGLLITAHADDIGLMVRFVNPDGSIRVCSVGGLHGFEVEDANVRLYARDGRMYTGTMRRKNCSLHLMTDEERRAPADYDSNLFLFLDEDVHSQEDVAALGIRCGDIIAIEPSTAFTPSGYIKSRHLDDKASTAILLTFMRMLREEGITPPRHLTAHFSLYEEIGHGGACGIPEDTVDVLAIDIGCCGPMQHSDERKVSICVKDTAFPYHRGMVDDLIAAAEREGIAYALDTFLPRYGSDAEIPVRLGRDVRHGLSARACWRRMAMSARIRDPWWKPSPC